MRHYRQKRHVNFTSHVYNLNFISEVAEDGEEEREKAAKLVIAVHVCVLIFVNVNTLDICDEGRVTFQISCTSYH